MHEKMSFREWCVFTISSFTVGSAAAIPGYFLILYASGVWLFVGWALVVIGAGLFLIASGIFATTMFFIAIAALFFNPIVGGVCALIALLSYGVQIKWVEQARANSLEEAEKANDKYYCRPETQKIGDQLGSQALRYANEKLAARLKEFDVEAFKRKMEKRKAGEKFDRQSVRNIADH